MTTSRGYHPNALSVWQSAAVFLTEIYFSIKKPTLKQPKEIFKRPFETLLATTTSPDCAARAAHPAPPAQGRGDPGIPAQQEQGTQQPPDGGDMG